MNILEIKNLNKSYKNKIVLKDFSLSLKEGEIVSIIGPSGIGKSTLLRCINGLEAIDSGKIIINNKSFKKKISKNINLNIGLIFQDFNLFPQYSVIENIALPLQKVLKLKKEDAYKKAKDLLKKLKLEEKEKSYPFQLSGGEKQRLAIARAIALNPKIICLDEPTSSLDPKLVEQVYNIIKEIAIRKKGIIIVTHDMVFAEKISDRIVSIK